MEIVMNDLFCDRSGVPNMVQTIRYIYGSMSFRVRFFDGTVRHFDGGVMCPSLELLQRNPTSMQMLEAESNITKLAEQHWAAWRSG